MPRQSWIWAPRSVRRNLRIACKGHAQGIAATLPRKAERQPKPIRHGTAWLVVTPENEILVERRPDSGLLGGMLAVPTTGWDANADRDPPIAGAQWQQIGEVRHTFTHFHLRLDVHLAEVSVDAKSRFLPLDEAEAAMPTVFAKSCRLLRQHLATKR